MSPSEAPESAEPYWAMASFSSAISSALIDTETLRALRSNRVMRASTFCADREALGPLVVAGRAREFVALDKGREVGADDLDVDTALLHVDHLAGDDRALAQVARRARLLTGLGHEGVPVPAA